MKASSPIFASLLETIAFKPREASARTLIHYDRGRSVSTLRMDVARTVVGGRTLLRRVIKVAMEQRASSTQSSPEVLDEHPLVQTSSRAYAARHQERLHARARHQRHPVLTDIIAHGRALVLDGRDLNANEYSEPVPGGGRNRIVGALGRQGQPCGWSIAGTAEELGRSMPVM